MTWQLGAPGQATAAIAADRFDAATFTQARLLSGDFDRMIVEVAKEEDYVDDFFADFFALLHKGDPVVADAEAMATTHLGNHAMVEMFAKHKEVASLRSFTANDSYASIMATISMGSEIAAAYDALAEAREAANDVATIVSLYDDPALHEMGVAAVARVLDEAGQAARACAGGALPALVAAAKNAEAAAEAEAQLFAAFGIGPGQARRMSFDERSRLARRLSGSRVSRFASLIGSFRATARAERRRRIVGVPEEVIGVHLGEDVLRLSAEEVIAMAIPELEDDFMVRAATGRLLVNTMTGTAAQGRGPIVMVVDESSSMNTQAGGITREAWSKAFALALAEVARIGGRDLTYIGFSSASEQRTVHFPAGATPIEKILDMVEHQFNGGTAYVPALNAALDVVQGQSAGNRGDIVFVTDGEHPGLPACLVARFDAVKAATSMRVFAATIGFAGAHSPAITAIADDVREITDLADPAALTDIFRSL